MHAHKLALIAFTVLSSSVIGTSLMADEAHHPDAGPQSATRGAVTQGQGMMDMDRMQEHMKSMQQLMERIHKNDDPATRQKLMSEHMQEMQQTMSDMRGMMMGPGMMQGSPGGKMGSGMMGGGTMMGNGKGMPMEDRQKMMEQRMDMMQGMMEQMMEHMMAAQPAEKQGKNKKDDEHEHKEKQ